VWLGGEMWGRRVVGEGGSDVAQQPTPPHTREPTKIIDEKTKQKQYTHDNEQEQRPKKTPPKINKKNKTNRTKKNNTTKSKIAAHAKTETKRDTKKKKQLMTWAPYRTEGRIKGIKMGLKKNFPPKGDGKIGSTDFSVEGAKGVRQ